MQWIIVFSLGKQSVSQVISNLSQNSNILEKKIDRSCTSIVHVKMATYSKSILSFEILLTKTRDSSSMSLSDICITPV